MALERETYRKKKKPLQIICWQRLLLLLDETLILSEMKKIDIVMKGILKKINIVVINKILRFSSDLKDKHCYQENCHQTISVTHGAPTWNNL